jgi:hypothetical protein
MAVHSSGAVMRSPRPGSRPHCWISVFSRRRISGAMRGPWHPCPPTSGLPESQHAGQCVTRGPGPTRRLAAAGASPQPWPGDAGTWKKLLIEPHPIRRRSSRHGSLWRDAPRRASSGAGLAPELQRGDADRPKAPRMRCPATSSGTPLIVREFVRTLDYAAVNRGQRGISRPGE